MKASASRVPASARPSRATRPAPEHALLGLQRQAGNRAVAGLLAQREPAGSSRARRRGRPSFEDPNTTLTGTWAQGIVEALQVIFDTSRRLDPNDGTAAIHTVLSLRAAATGNQQALRTLRAFETGTMGKIGKLSKGIDILGNALTILNDPTFAGGDRGRDRYRRHPRQGHATVQGQGHPRLREERRHRP